MGTQASGKCFHSFFEFCQTFTNVSVTLELIEINMENRLSTCISFRKHRDKEKENNLLTLIIKM